MNLTATDQDGVRAISVVATLKSGADLDALLLRLDRFRVWLTDEEDPRAASQAEPEPIVWPVAPVARQEVPAPAAEPKPEPVPDQKEAGARRRERMREVVRELWPTAKKQSEIAKILGVTDGRVWQIARELGLPPRHQLTHGGAGSMPNTGLRPASPPPSPPPANEEPPAELAPVPPEPAPVEEPIEVAANSEPTAIPDCHLTVGAIEHAGKTLEITPRQYAVLKVLLPAAPAPVSVNHVLKRAFASMTSADGLFHLQAVKSDLAHGLPGIGLVFREIKGVGLAVQEAA